MLLNPLTFHAPTSLKEAIELYTNLESVRLQAGGTFLLNSLKLLKRKGTKTPEHVISLRKINELKGITKEGGRLVIRAMTIINELFDTPLLTGHWAVLRTVAKNISTNPIRNMATVGGNLTCRYTWTEMPAVMVGLEAELHFLGPDGQTEVLPAEKFFANGAKTDKIFTHVSIPKDPTASVAYRRIKKTPNVDIPLLSLLIKTNFDGARFTRTRVAVNNCVTFAQRDRLLEDYLDRSERYEKTVQEALDHLDKTIYDTRSNDYKKQMFRASLQSALRELVNNKPDKQ